MKENNKNQIKQTLAQKFIAKAVLLLPEQSDLQELDPTIDCPHHIDEIMFHKSEYVGGMAVVILELIK